MDVHCSDLTPYMSHIEMCHPFDFSVSQVIHIYFQARILVSIQVSYTSSGKTSLTFDIVAVVCDFGLHWCEALECNNIISSSWLFLFWFRVLLPVVYSKTYCDLNAACIDKINTNKSEEIYCILKSHSPLWPGKLSADRDVCYSIRFLSKG